jgi:hypothetical protein
MALTSKFNLGISEIFSPVIHGLNINSDREMASRFLVFTTISNEEFYNNEHEELIDIVTQQYDRLFDITPNTVLHPFIQTYRNIAKNFIRLDIIKMDVLETEETICTIHTFWIKIIQRKWKKIFNERKKILNYRKNIGNLMSRELMGRYKKNNCFPEFKLGLAN